ncbi:4780_t:CDS:1, partial [Ambispora leptoticha]
MSKRESDRPQPESSKDDQTESSKKNKIKIEEIIPDFSVLARPGYG